ncbi:hypothetical protein CDO73_17160, partial [Saccharibacillus sp. O23]
MSRIGRSRCAFRNLPIRLFRRRTLRVLKPENAHPGALVCFEKRFGQRVSGCSDECPALSKAAAPSCFRNPRLSGTRSFFRQNKQTAKRIRLPVGTAR